MDAATSDLLSRYDGTLPRYTSYPTATRFGEAVGPADVSFWLGALTPGEALSLYIHVPFCDALCAFCGCNTSVVRSEATRATYAALLCDELARVAACISCLPGRRPPVTHIQFGGGTPTTLPPQSLRAVMETIQSLFDVGSNADIAIELDPRHFSMATASLLASLNVTRASLGVQDLDPIVQRACGRIQSVEQTRECVNALRAQGIRGVNIDLIYGLPRQTAEGARQTCEMVAALRPDRLAVFGYAHVPWKLKRQRLIPDDTLPGRDERFAQRQQIDAVLVGHGYHAIGLDHYALPEDALALAARQGTLRRNFQGYTTDSARALIGVGASAISMLPDGYAQNCVSSADYARALGGSPALPVARGVARSEDDILRGAVIERLMCDFAICFTEWGTERFQPERTRLERFAQDGLVLMTDDALQVTEAGRPFVRNIAAVFDRYLPATGAGPGQHARAI